MAVDELCAEISLRVSASPFCRQSAVASRVWAGSSTAMAEGGEGEDEIQFLRTVSKDGSVGSVRVWRALPSISINAVRRGAFVCHNCKCKLFHQVCGGGFTHGGVPLVAAVAPGDRTLVGGMLMWLQVRGKKWLFQTSHSFFPSAEAPRASSFPPDVLITIPCEIEEFHQVRPARTPTAPCNDYFCCLTQIRALCVVMHSIYPCKRYDSLCDVWWEYQGWGVVSRILPLLWPWRWVKSKKTQQQHVPWTCAPTPVHGRCFLSLLRPVPLVWLLKYRIINDISAVIVPRVPRVLILDLLNVSSNASW